MKKKQISSKIVNKPKKSLHSIPKRPSKTKAKPTHVSPPSEAVQYYVMLDGGFYSANSTTERQAYHQFQQQIKKIRPRPSKSFAEMETSSHTAESKESLEEYVKTLTVDEKRTLLKKLQQEMNLQNIHDASKQKQVPAKQMPQTVEDKLVKLQSKLQQMKQDLDNKWLSQISKTNQLHELGQISQAEREDKISLMQKIKTSKLTMIQCTKLLFNRILREEPQDNRNQEEQIDEILNSLKSFSSLELGQQSKDQEKSDSLCIRIQNKEGQSKSPIRQTFNEGEEEAAKRYLSAKSQPDQSGDISERLKQTEINCNDLKLDIRLDQVQFGKDTYEDEEPQAIQVEIMEEESKASAPPQPQCIEIKQESKKIEEVILYPQSQSPESQKGSGFKIPLIMTKDRLETIQAQRQKKQLQSLKEQIQKRVSVQLSCIEPDPAIPHFTTLVDINSFIVSFYEFMMRNKLQQVVDNMNIPYGKSAVDKLYCLRVYGQIDDYDLAHVLTEQHLQLYHQEMALTVRKIGQYQKSHNRAVFEAFNKSLNFYRPYFELEGEVYPWIVSQKAITFYQITEQNIQQVFQKSKIKILEYCSSLCGLMPPIQLTIPQSKAILERRHEESLSKSLKSETIEIYNEWNVKFVNFEAMIRLQIVERIFTEEIGKAIQQAKAILQRQTNFSIE